jgi:hypothetical protein
VGWTRIFKYIILNDTFQIKLCFTLGAFSCCRYSLPEAKKTGQIGENLFSASGELKHPDSL